MVVTITLHHLSSCSLRKLNKLHQQTLTLQLIRRFRILGRLPNPKPMLVLLHAHLINDMLRALLVNDGRLPLDVLLRLLLHVLVGLDVVGEPLVLVSHLDEELLYLA